MRCSSNTVYSALISYMCVGYVHASHSVSFHSSSTETSHLHVERLKLISASLHVVVSLGLL